MNKKILFISLFLAISTYLQSMQSTQTQTDKVFDADELFFSGLEYFKAGAIKEALELFEEAAALEHTQAQYFSALILYKDGNCSNVEIFDAFKYCRQAARKNFEPAIILSRIMLPDITAALLEESDKALKIDLDLEKLLKKENNNKQSKKKPREDKEEEKARKRIRKQGPPQGMYI